MNARALVRVALLAAVGLGLIAAWSLGLVELLMDPDETAAVLRSMGAWGYLLYVASFSLLSPFFVPGIAFVVPAAMIWPPWLALLLSLVGAGGAGSVGFAFARFLARDWVATRIPTPLRRWDDALRTRPIRTVILIRILFAFLPPAHWALGISGIRYRPFLLGTVIGLVPMVTGLTWIGGEFMDWINGQTRQGWVWIAFGVLMIALGFRFLARRRQQASNDPQYEVVEP
jgi:uncharacterized membrane protein YdjX (TVP38/TMEM64 family)